MRRLLYSAELLKNAVRWRVFDEPALVQKQDLVGQTTGLPQVVRGHDNLCACVVNMLEQRFHGLGCCRVKAGGWFIKEQHLGLEGPGTRQGKALLLPT